jgi:tetratricopeptide (TPR) repeat protein
LFLFVGQWDPDVFYKFRDTILDQVPTAGHKLRNDLCRGVPNVWDKYYILDKDKDIAFEIGRFYYGIREYASALKFYQRSVKTVGEHHVTYHNMGLCFYSMGKMENALENFGKSLTMHPHYEKARSWRDRVKNELAAEAAGTSTEGVQLSMSATGERVVVTGDVEITNLEDFTAEDTAVTADPPGPPVATAVAVEVTSDGPETASSPVATLADPES